MIRYQCPWCASVLESPADRCGRQISCPRCQRNLKIPHPPQNRFRFRVPARAWLALIPVGLLFVVFTSWMLTRSWLRRDPLPAPSQNSAVTPNKPRKETDPERKQSSEPEPNPEAISPALPPPADKVEVKKKKPAPQPAETFADIDRHALAATPEEESTVDALAYYLIRPARNDREKIRAIFRWTADRIAYDVAAIESGKYPDCSPENVLARRKTICEGYANLVVALCRRSGLEAVKVPGFVKPDNYKKGGPFINHAWNAVKIQGTWHLLDATWGSGFILQKKFVRYFDNYFFLTPPGEFAWHHLPREDRWQLLADPLTLKEFKDSPRIDPLLFEMGFALPAVAKKIRDNPPGGFVKTFVQSRKTHIESAPVEFRLREGAKYSFRFQAPGALEAAFFHGDRLVDLLNKSDRTFSGTIAPGQGRLRIMIRTNPDRPEFFSILEYGVEKAPAPAVSLLK